VLCWLRRVEARIEKHHFRSQTSRTHQWSIHQTTEQDTQEGSEYSGDDHHDRASHCTMHRLINYRSVFQIFGLNDLDGGTLTTKASSSTHFDAGWWCQGTEEIDTKGTQRCEVERDSVDLKLDGVCESDVCLKKDYNLCSFKTDSVFFIKKIESEDFKLCLIEVDWVPQWMKWDSGERDNRKCSSSYSFHIWLLRISFDPLLDTSGRNKSIDVVSVLSQWNNSSSNTSKVKSSGGVVKIKGGVILSVLCGTGCIRKFHHLFQIHPHPGVPQKLSFKVLDFSVGTLVLVLHHSWWSSQCNMCVYGSMTVWIYNVCMCIHTYVYILITCTFNPQLFLSLVHPSVSESWPEYSGLSGLLKTSF
jgi:hypothetical protein